MKLRAVLQQESLGVSFLLDKEPISLHATGALGSGCGRRVSRLGATDIQPASAPPKDKRWIKTRERLVRAGFDLVGRQGIGAIGVDEIVGLAGTAKQSFYNHFADRDAFLLELRRQSREIFETIVTRINTGVDSPIERLAQGVAVHARMALLDPLHARFFANVAALTFTEEQALNVGLVGDLETGQALGQFRFGSIEAAVTITGAVTQVIVAHLLELEHDVVAVPLTQEMLTMLMRGLGTESDTAEQTAARMTNRVFLMEAGSLTG